MTVERRLTRLEGRAAVGRGLIVVGVQGADGMVRYGDKLLTLAEFEALRADSHILLTRRTAITDATATA